MNVLSLLSIRIKKIIINKKNNKISSSIFLIFQSKEYKLNVNFIDSIIVSIMTNTNLYLCSNFFNCNDSTANNVEVNVLDHNCKEPRKLNNLKNILIVLIKNEDYESAILVKNRIDQILS